jgi:hypothetical protein
MDAGLDTTDMPLPGRPAPSDVAPWQPVNPPGSSFVGPPAYRPASGSPGDFSSIRPQAAPVAGERFTESTWYSRVEYFHWNERLDGADFVNEYGVLPTVGYQHRSGPERFRLELFGSTMDYHGAAMYDDGSSEPLTCTTNYLGVRGEYDLLLEPDFWPRVSFFAGIGTRFWIRDLVDGLTESGNPVMGYQETWWTIYPYLGVESRRVVRDGLELYGSGRIGCTAVTYERAGYFDVTLYPKAGLEGQAELGVRSRRLLLAAYLEAMTWRESSIVRDTLQPNSRLFTVGLKAGFSF